MSVTDVTPTDTTVSGARKINWARLRAPWVRYAAAVVLTVIVANGVALVVTDTNPLLRQSGLRLTQTQTQEHTWPGTPTIDPNDGFTTQALGVASMRQLLSGKLPLWNHDEGVGQPLAGGMQPAALFPFTILMLLPGGVLIFHMVLEMLAGIGMLLLLRKLGFRWGIATTGGILFALNGTFAWLTNAVFNPVAFLPWLLLAVEFARGSTGWRATRGWGLAAASIALSLYAGFPEVAYLDALLAVGWFLARLPGVKDKLSYTMSLGVGALAGVVLALPVVVPFLEYLPNAWIGGHGGFSNVSLPPVGLVMLTLPYAFGPIFGYTAYYPSQDLASIWANVGGYLTLGTVVLGVVGLFARSAPQALRAVLAAFSVLAVARIYGVPALGQVLDLLPGMGAIAVYRYIVPALSAALIVLAAYGTRQVEERLLPLKRPVRLALAAVVAVAGIVLFAVAVHRALRLRGAPELTLWLSFFTALAALVLVVLVLAIGGLRVARHAVIPVVLIEAIVLFAVPQFSAPARGTAVDTTPIEYLQQHLGQGRFFALGSIQPNYGSYYGIASANDNNLPVPKSWADYISQHLDSQSFPAAFTGTYDPDASDKVTPKTQFLDNFESYEAIGVSYLVAANGTLTAQEMQQYGIVEASVDSATTIYQLPNPASYFSTDTGCAVTATDRDAAQLDCPTPVKLQRLELFYPGWRVTIDGTDTPLQQDGLFQAVTVPAGRHTVSYRYWPPGMTAALVASLGTLVLLVAAGVAPLIVRRRATRGTLVPRRR
jgi:hypothetical protein